jgi:hypothetical protein
MPLIQDVVFSVNKAMQKAIVKKLNASNFIWLSELEHIESWQLFKIRSFGFLKVALVQEVMKEHKLFFKDKRWTKGTAMNKALNIRRSNHI